jgi:N6-adenosine-specific RNA methylase IME4
MTWEGLSPPYRTIVADPPWTPELGSTWSESSTAQRRGSPKRHYSTMALDDISDLPVSDLAAAQAHLYVWAITPHVDWGFAVARAWGFEPLTMFTWKKPGLGVGRFRCNTEHVIVARRGDRIGNPFGQGGRHQQATDGTLFDWPRGAHSEKPAAFLDLVEALSPGPYVELFARSPRLGWDSWGHGWEQAS